MSAARAKRFWKQASAVLRDAGWSVELDGRAVRTPAGALCAAPNRATAEAAAAEWDAQDEGVDAATMPVTRALNTAIDRIAPQLDSVRAEVAGYGGSDLLCYRAPHPAELKVRQSAAWDPPLAWARETLGAGLICVEGVMHAPQPAEALARLSEAVAVRDPFALAALHDLVTLSGSLVLGLAVSDGAMAWEEAWEASRVDERWNAEQWGEDAEAAAAEARKRDDFAAAARLDSLLRVADGAD